MNPPTVLRLGHSPDPDDAFMFYALAQNPPLIPTGPWRFEHILQDIQILNQRAMKGDLEITAISIHAYPYVADKYALTSCGSSMGDNYGPMVVAREPMTIDQLRGKTIAIPGALTTAFLALQLTLGKPARISPSPGTPGEGRGEGSSSSLNAHVLPFDQILQYVRDGKADAGLIIHEGQLTYQKENLHLVLDLGKWWYEKTDLPLPLGGNCIRKDIGRDAMQQITNILKASIQYSLKHRKQAVDYALNFGRDLDRNLADKFVGMYVNKWTLDYGPRGRQAISRLLKEGAAAGICPDAGEVEYITAA